MFIEQVRLLMSYSRLPPLPKKYFFLKRNIKLNNEHKMNVIGNLNVIEIIRFTLM